MSAELYENKAKEGFCCGCGRELTGDELYYFGISCNSCEEAWHDELNAGLDSERKKLLGGA